MMSESNRMFVAGGLLIGALVLATLGLRFGNRESAAQEADGRVDTALSSAARPVTPDAPIDDPREAGVERVLQAVHDSLQLGDLASARVLLDAVLAMRRNEPQALLLEQELATREKQAREENATPLDEQSAARPHVHARTSARTMFARANTPHRSMDTTEPGEAVTDAPPPADTRSGSVKDDATASDHAASAVPFQAHTQPEPAVAAAVQTAATAAEPIDKPVEPATTSVAQNNDAAASPTAVATTASTSGAPKTRAEVRDELSRARKNGTMSRFGNPDLYGPGGSPSYNAQPSIRTW